MSASGYRSRSTWSSTTAARWTFCSSSSEVSAENGSMSSVPVIAASGAYTPASATVSPVSASYQVVKSDGNPSNPKSTVSASSRPSSTGVWKVGEWGRESMTCWSVAMVTSASCLPVGANRPPLPDMPTSLLRLLGMVMLLVVVSSRGSGRCRRLPGRTPAAPCRQIGGSFGVLQPHPVGPLDVLVEAAIEVVDLQVRGVAVVGAHDLLDAGADDRIGD